MVVRRTTKKVSANPVAALPAPDAAFTIVGIGASADGLEALGLFFRDVPAACGMAFVVVQHPVYFLRSLAADHA